MDLKQHMDAQASVEQLDIWLAVQQDPESARYNVPVYLDLQGPVDVAALRLALADVAGRHGALHSRFTLEGGALRETRGEAVPVPLLVHDRGAAAGRDEAFRLAVSDAARPLNLSGGSLLRAGLFPYADARADTAVLCLVTHHIVADRWSLDVLSRHLMEAYSARVEGLAPDLGAPAPQEASSPEADRFGAPYWQELLDGEWAWLLPLPDRVREEAAPQALRSSGTFLSDGAFAGLRERAGELHLSPTLAVFGAWTLLLHGWSGIGDGIIGMPFSGRNAESSHDEVGLFTRVLPVRSRLARDTAVAGHLEELRDQVLESMEYSEVPVDHLRGRQNAAGDSAFVPRSVFTPYGEPPTLTAAGGLTARPLDDPEDLAHYPVSLVMLEEDGRLQLRVDYDSRIYGPQTAQLLLRQLVTVVEGLCEDADRTCGELLDDLARPVPGTADAPSDAQPVPGLLELVTAQAERRPGAVAVRRGSYELTYRELVDRARAEAVRWEDAPAGTAALPGAPGAEAVVRALADAFAAAEPGVTGSEGAQDARRALHALGRVVSGDFLGFGEDDTVAHLAPAGSDGAAYEIWGALSRGACLAVPDEEDGSGAEGLRRTLHRHHVTALVLATDRFHSLVDGAVDVLQSVRHVRVFGGPLSVPLVRRALRWCGAGVLRFGYVPRPGALVATCAVLDAVEEHATAVPLGEAGPGVRAEVVLAGAACPAPVGMPGELVVDGVRAASGPRVRRTPAGRLEPVREDRPRREEAAAVAAPKALAPPRPADGEAVGLVLAAWGAVLAAGPEGIDDNFFDVGGNSLLVIRLQQSIRELSGVTVAIPDLFRHTTVRTQAALLEGGPTPVLPAAPQQPARTVQSDDDIAVIGMGCRFAGSPDKDAFWSNLLAGRQLITTSPDPEQPDLGNGSKRIPRWGLMGDGVGYDAEMLGFSQDELATADPQHGVLYECLWAAVEDAALKISDIGPSTSLFVGADRSNENTYWGTREQPLRADDVIATSATFMPSRFAYWNNLWGENLLIDTACSTSLVAVHLACASLRSGSSDYALAGGVSIDNPEDGGYTFTPGHLYSKDGVCRPFDVHASGTVGGDGAGAVLLRRLSDAVRDGDPIYAVIRGSAVNNDGISRVGYSAPGVEGQARVIRKALDAAGVTGDQVDYVEPHGTGTRLGDAIEAIALSEALGPDGPEVAVGGLKSSIGHTNHAAGVAGLIKAALAVHSGILPGTPTASEPIGEMSANGGRLRLTPQTRAWPEREHPRTAGVSSFGVGGTNAHVVLQEFRGSDLEAKSGV